MIEADMPRVMWVGFGFIIFISSFILFLCYRGLARKDGYVFFILQGLFTIISFLFILNALTRIPHSYSMFTEDVSLSIGLAGLSWGISIFFMLVGIWKISRVKME